MELDGTTLNLIEIVKQNPSLYDPKHPSFKDRTKKKEIWETIANELHVSSIEAKTRWQSLRRQYITRRSKNLPADTHLDNLMSFMEGCCGLGQTQKRSVVKPQLPAPTISDAILPKTSTSISRNENPGFTSNDGPSSPTTKTTPGSDISSSTYQEDPTIHWLSLFFAELSQKARNLPISKQLDIAKQVGKICEEVAEESSARSSESD